jgi:hypothetical protein
VKGVRDFVKGKKLDKIWRLHVGGEQQREGEYKEVRGFDTG